MAASAEVNLISSVLRDRDIQKVFALNVTADLFHSYSAEWEWLEAYQQKHRKVPTRVAFLEAFPDFKIRSVNDTGHYAQSVKKSHAQHELTTMIREVADHISQGDVDKAIGMVQQSVIDVSTSMGAVYDGDVLNENEDIEQELLLRRERQQQYGSAGIPTGFPTLDERTGGPQPGELWIVGARLGEGKSYAMQCMAVNAILNGKKVQFDALEQTRAQVSMRIYSMLSAQMPGSKYVFSASDLMQGRNYDPATFGTSSHRSRRWTARCLSLMPNGGGYRHPPSPVRSNAMIPTSCSWTT